MTPEDHFWNMAHLRQEMLWHRAHGYLYEVPCPILRNHRFTNCYRASDRVSQYLINVVQRADKPVEKLIRDTLLFKMFNKIETWEELSKRVDINDDNAVERALDQMYDEGYTLYNNAYMMNTPGIGMRKHRMHMACLRDFRIGPWESVRDIFETLHDIKNFGNFLAYQFAIDINYLLGFDESKFVQPGPGAKEGAAKIAPGIDPTYLIEKLYDNQVEGFMSRDLEFRWFRPRPLQFIDIQNLLCEIGKYLREAMPELNAKRANIKQKYRGPYGPMYKIKFPDSWGVDMSTW